LVLHYILSPLSSRLFLIPGTLTTLPDLDLYQGCPSKAFVWFFHLIPFLFHSFLYACLHGHRRTLIPRLDSMKSGSCFLLFLRFVFPMGFGCIYYFGLWFIQFGSEPSFYLLR
jgi:hypothetical protein